MANLKLRVLPKFPTSVAAGNLMTVTKANGIWTFAVDFSHLGAVSSFTNPTTDFFPFYDSTAATYLSASFTNLAAAVGATFLPAVSVDNTVPRFDGVAGHLQTSGVTINDSDGLTAVGISVTTGGINAGIAGSSLGFMSVQGNTSGVITIKPQAIAGTYNFNLPITAGAANTIMLSGGGGATPMAWSTTTWPATTTINRLLWSSAANVISDLATANGAILNTSSSGVPALTSAANIGVKGTSSGSINLLSDTGAGSLGNLSLAAGTGVGTSASIAFLGSTSGQINIQAQAAAGSYNFNLPTTAGASGTMLQSGGGGAAAMAFTTTTWPATTTINRLLWSSGTNAISDLATANGGVVNTSSGGVPSVTPTPTLGVKATTSGSISLQSDTGAGSLGNMSLSAGVGAAASPSIAFFGPTSGQVNVQVAAAAGSWTFKWPTTAGTNLQFMQTDGSGNATWASTRSIMTFTNGTVSQAQNVSAFQVTISTTTENLAQFVIPYACTIKNLYAVSTAPAAGQTCIFMVRKNSADTTLTCTVTGTGTTSNDTTHSVTFAAGDLIGIKTTTSATSGTMLLMQCSVEVDSP